MWMKPRKCMKCRICGLEINNNNQAVCKSCYCHTSISPSPTMAKCSLSAKLGFSRNQKPDDHHIPITHHSRSLNYGSDHLANKRAVLCGVSYRSVKYQLGGTINDVRRMRDLLISNFGYKKEWIRVLTEEETHPNFLPTKANIINSMKWLMEKNQAGNSLVFFFSGHGLRQPDFDQDELDGFDETICPMDYKEHGMIVDNEINSILVSPLIKDVTLHAIVDACHSGTILDLPHVFDTNTKGWKDNKTPLGKQKTTKGGFAISISACDDNQLAADTTVFTKNTMNGAMTYLLAEQLRKFPGLTYGNYLDLISGRIQDANKNKFLSSSRVLKKVFPNRMLETPIISSSEQFNIDEREITL
ncbi:hypothetical protein ACFE04_007356 [Oxalis oulophora]